MSSLSYAPNSTQVINDSTLPLFDATKKPIAIDVVGTTMVAGQNSGDGALFYNKNVSDVWEQSNIKNSSAVSFLSGTNFKVMDSCANLTFESFKNALNNDARSAAESDTITIGDDIYKFYSPTVGPAPDFYKDGVVVFPPPSLFQNDEFNIKTYVTGAQELRTKTQYSIRGLSSNKVSLDDLFSQDISAVTAGQHEVQIFEVKPDYNSKFFKYSNPSSNPYEIWKYKNSVYHNDVSLQRIGVVDFNTDNTAVGGGVNIIKNNEFLTLTVGLTDSSGVGTLATNIVGLNNANYASGAYAGGVGVVGGVWEFGETSAGLKGKIKVYNKDDHPFKLTNINFDSQNGNTLDSPGKLELKYVSGAVDASNSGSAVVANTVTTIDWGSGQDASSNINLGELTNYWVMPSTAAIFEFEWSGVQNAVDNNTYTINDISGGNAGYATLPTLDVSKNDSWGADGIVDSNSTAGFLLTKTSGAGYLDASGIRTGDSVGYFNLAIEGNKLDISNNYVLSLDVSGVSLGNSLDLTYNGGTLSLTKGVGGDGYNADFSFNSSDIPDGNNLDFSFNLGPHGALYKLKIVENGIDEGTGLANVYIDNVQARGQYKDVHNTWTVTDPDDANVAYDENALRTNVFQNNFSARLGHTNNIIWDGPTAAAFNVDLTDCEVSRTQGLSLNTNGVRLLDMTHNDYHSHTDTSFSMAATGGVSRYVDIQTGTAAEMKDGAVALNSTGLTSIIGLKNANTQVYNNGAGEGVKPASGFAYVLDKLNVTEIGNIWSLGNGDGITSHASSGDTSGNYKLNYFVDNVHAGEQFGSSVDITDNGNFVAIGGPGHESGMGRCAFLARYGVGVGDITNEFGNTLRNGPFSWRPFAPDIVGAAGDGVGTSVKLNTNGSRVLVAVKGSDCARVYDASYLFTAGNIGQSFNPVGGLDFKHVDGSGNEHPIMWKDKVVHDGESWLSQEALIETIESNGYVKLAGGKSFVNPVVEWNQVGGDIALDGCKNVDANSSISKVIVSNEEYNSGMGAAAVYNYDGSAWTVVGAQMTGDVQGELFGKSVSMDGAGNFVTIGVPHKGTSVGGNTWNTDSCGNVLVYKVTADALLSANGSAKGAAMGDELGWDTVAKSGGSTDLSDVTFYSVAYNGVVALGEVDNNNPATDGKQYINAFNMVYSALTPSVASPALTNDTTPVVTGTGEPNATVNIKKISDDSIIGTGTVGSDGAFSLTLAASSLAEGTNNVYAHNVDKSSASFNIVLDSIAPVLKFTTTGTNILEIVDGVMANSILSLSGDLLDVPGDIIAPGLTSDPSNVDTTTYGDKLVSYYGTDAAGNDVTDTNANANAVLTFRISPSLVDPVVTGPALTKSQTPTVVGTATHDISYDVLDVNDTVLASGFVANNGSISTVISQLSEGTHNLRIRSQYLHPGDGMLTHTSVPFSMEIDITSPILDFSNGTRSQLVFVGEGATFNTKNSGLLNLPADLVNGMSGLTANVASINANVAGSTVVNYSGLDAAGNPLKDSNNTSPAQLTYNVVAVNNPNTLSATYDGSCVLISWRQVGGTNTPAAFNRFEVLTNNANPISVAGNNVYNFVNIPNTAMGVAVTYTVRVVVDGAVNEAAGTGTDISITPIALTDSHKRGSTKTAINSALINLTNDERRRIFKNLFDNNPLPRSEKRVLVDKASLKFYANKLNYTRIKNDVIVLPPEDANTDVLVIRRQDLANKTIYSALEVDGVLKISFQGKENIYKLTQKSTVLEVKDYINAAALAANSHASVVNKSPGTAFEIGHANVILTVGSVIITAGDIPCLTKGTLVKTPTGFKKVEKLSIGDNVTTHDGRVVPITGLIRNNTETTSTNTPYIIPKDYFAKNMPKADFTISPNHAVSADTDGNEWFIPAHHGADLERVPVGERVSYFHVELPNWLIDNLVINKTMVVESHAATYHKNLELNNPLYEEQKNGLYRRSYKAYAHQERVIKLKAAEERQRKRVSKKIGV